MAQAAVAVRPTAAPKAYHGCSGIREYELMDKLGEGTFGYVDLDHRSLLY
jgi:hypothetical protein